MATPLDNWQNKVNVFYEDDGENIADNIKSKLSSQQFAFHVTCYKLGQRLQSITDGVCVFLLTEDSVAIFKTKDTTIFQAICPCKTPMLILKHETVTDLSDKEIKEIMTKHNIADYAIKVLVDSNSLKKAFLKIIQLAESSHIAPVLKSFTLCPTEIWTDSDPVMVIFKKEKERQKVEIKVISKFGKEISYTAEKVKRNKVLFQFTPEGIIPGSYDIDVLVDGQPAGRDKLILKSKMELVSSLLKDVVNPVDLICQVIGIDIGTESLDLELKDIFTNGIGNPLAGLEGLDGSQLQIQDGKCEFPTLLHLGARLGLEHFCLALLEYPGAHRALRMKNKDGKTPSKLAVTAKCTDLASRLLVSEDSMNDDVFDNDEDHYMSMEGIQPLRDQRPDSQPLEQGVVLRRPRTLRESQGSSGDFPSSSSSSGFESMTERMTLMWDDIDIENPRALYRHGESSATKL